MDVVIRTKSENFRHCRITEEKGRSNNLIIKQGFIRAQMIVPCEGLLARVTAKTTTASYFSGEGSSERWSGRKRQPLWPFERNQEVTAALRGR